MPSPVGHSLIGLAVGLGYGLPRTRWRDVPAELKANSAFFLIAILLANAADLDYLPGLFMGDWNLYHHGSSHTLQWTLLVTVAVCMLWRAFRPEAGWRVFGFVFLVLLSHLLADWVTDDGSAPYGIMLFWPMSDSYYISPVKLFGQLQKRDLADFL